jgi:hypothetical protein
MREMIGRHAEEGGKAGAYDFFRRSGLLAYDFFRRSGLLAYDFFRRSLGRHLKKSGSCGNNAKPLYARPEAVSRQGAQGDRGRRGLLALGRVFLQPPQDFNFAIRYDIILVKILSSIEQQERVTIIVLIVK